MSGKAAKAQKMRSQIMHTKRSSAKPWTSDEKNALTTGVIRGLHTNVKKGAQNRGETSRKIH